ncbi:hypothetical protein [Hazenella coriacea]|uniref:Uncharacterized protein n=1 Tax=Hazenella coriacea TaxID=1179467 RepID=A0A4R3L6B4_9BACL|nr:hypothetical protein [Hazenella coriacea]TCS94962.1 hypothetical protein EDD58_103387 [Hazenella coriacea]
MNRTLDRLWEMSAKDGFPTVVTWDMYARKYDLYSVSALKQNLLSLTWDGIRKHLKLPQSRDRFTKEDCICSLLQASEELGEGFSKRQYE